MTSILFALLCLTASAQVDDPGWSTERRHMALLAGWSAANLAGGATGMAIAETPEMRAFHGTNAAWNTVNGAIAVAGLAGLPRHRTAEDSDALLKRHRSLQTTLAVNMGLDVLYIGAGAVMWATRKPQLGDTPTAPVGQSLMLQGGFLLGFDTAFLLSHRAKTRRPALPVR